IDKIKELKTQKDKVELELEKSRHKFDSLSKNKDEINSLVASSKEKLSRLKEVFKISVRKNNIITEGKKLRVLEGKLSVIPKINENIKKSNKLIEDLKIKKELFDRYSDFKRKEVQLSNEITKSNIFLDNTKEISNINDSMKRLKQLFKDIKEKNELMNKYIRLDKETKALECNLKKNESKLNSLNKIDINNIGEVKAKIDKFKQILNIKAKLNQVSEELEANAIKNNILDKEIKEKKSELKNKLMNLQSCPVCKSHIDENKVNEIVKDYFGA
ncbi:MAG: hypothetical protein R3Y64_11225, partial [Peptostreptococcaceae bacterium]